MYKTGVLAILFTTTMCVTSEYALYCRHRLSYFAQVNHCTERLVTNTMKRKGIAPHVNVLIISNTRVITLRNQLRRPLPNLGVLHLPRNNTGLFLMRFGDCKN